MIPRIQGKVGQATEPKEVEGKWFFEMWLTTLGGGDESQSLGLFGPWESEAIAQEELRRACQQACEAIEKKISGEASGHYIDMKTNQTRSWNERLH